MWTWVICSSVSFSPRSTAESRLLSLPRTRAGCCSCAASASASSIRSAISAFVSRCTPLLMSLGPMRSSPKNAAGLGHDLICLHWLVRGRLRITMHLACIEALQYTEVLTSYREQTFSIIPSKSQMANAQTVFVSAVARGLKTLKMLMNF